MSARNETDRTIQFGTLEDLTRWVTFKATPGLFDWIPDIQGPFFRDEVTGKITADIRVHVRSKVLIDVLGNTVKIEDDLAQKDHGTLLGLADDDHLQYAHRTGIRPFTGTIGGIDPTDPTHLTTKNYTDLELLLPKYGETYVEGTVLGEYTHSLVSDGATITYTFVPDAGTVQIFLNGKLFTWAGDSITIPPGTATVAAGRWVRAKDDLAGGIELEVLNSFEDAIGPPGGGGLVIQTSGETALLAGMGVQDAATVQVQGTIAFRSYTSDVDAHSVHLDDRVRVGERLKWFSGMDPTTQVVATTEVHYAHTIGRILALHFWDMPAFDSQVADNFILIQNHPTTKWLSVADLGFNAGVDVDSTGASLNAKSYNIVIFAAINQLTGSPTQILINLPNDSYNVPGDAITDPNQTADFVIPGPSGTSTNYVVLARIVLREMGGGVMSIEAFFDLRGGLQIETSGLVSSQPTWTERDGLPIVNPGIITLPNDFLQDNLDGSIDVRLDLLEPLYSGLFAGGEVSLNAGVVMDITAGFGIITDAYTNSLDVDYELVAWGASQVTLNADGVWFIYVGPGSVVTAAQAAPLTRSVVTLAEAVVLGGALFTLFPVVFPARGAGGSVQDLLQITSKTSGLAVTGVAATLSLDRAPGNIFAPGIAFHTNDFAPHLAAILGSTPINFAYILSTDVLGGGATTFISPDSWENPLGTVASVGLPNAQTTIQRVYLLPSGDHAMMFGQTIYVDIGTAQASINADNATHVTSPFLDAVGDLLAHVVISRAAIDTTDELTTIIVLPAGAGGGGGGSSGAVDSVHGRTGTVVAQLGDRSGLLVGYDNSSSGLTAVTSQAAIDELFTGGLDGLFVPRAGGIFTGDIGVTKTVGDALVELIGAAAADGEIRFKETGQTGFGKIVGDGLQLLMSYDNVGDKSALKLISGEGQVAHDGSTFEKIAVIGDLPTDFVSKSAGGTFSSSIVVERPGVGPTIGLSIDPGNTGAFSLRKSGIGSASAIMNYNPDTFLMTISNADASFNHSVLEFTPGSSIFVDRSSRSLDNGEIATEPWVTLRHALLDGTNQPFTGSIQVKNPSANSVMTIITEPGRTGIINFIPSGVGNIGAIISRDHDSQDFRIAAVDGIGRSAELIFLPGTSIFVGRDGGDSSIWDGEVATEPYVDFQFAKLDGSNQPFFAVLQAPGIENEDGGGARLTLDLTLATFSTVVSGVTPTIDAHLATKAYVDGGGGGLFALIDASNQPFTGGLQAPFIEDQAGGGARLTLTPTLAAFNTVVSGVTPTIDAHFATKLYVDDAIPVDSVFSRTGIVVSQLSDYDASQIDNDSGVDGATVAAALDALEAQVTAGIFYVERVISRIPDPPGGPTLLDRYIIDGVGTGAWATHDNEIAEWNGSSWDFTVPVGGMATFVDLDLKTFAFSVTDDKWVPLGSITSHSDLTNLTADDHPQYSLVDGTRAFTGGIRAPFIEDQVGGGARLTLDPTLATFNKNLTVATSGSTNLVVHDTSAPGETRMHSESAAASFERYTGTIVGSRVLLADTTASIRAGAGGLGADLSLLVASAILQVPSGAKLTLDAALATFNTVASGVTPTIDAHLATKGYVDLQVPDVSGFAKLDASNQPFTGGLRAPSIENEAGGGAKLTLDAANAVLNAPTQAIISTDGATGSKLTLNTGEAGAVIDGAFNQDLDVLAAASGFATVLVGEGGSTQQGLFQRSGSTHNVSVSWIDGTVKSRLELTATTADLEVVGGAKMMLDASSAVLQASDSGTKLTLDDTFLTTLGNLKVRPLSAGSIIHLEAEAGQIARLNLRPNGMTTGGTGRFESPGDGLSAFVEYFGGAKLTLDATEATVTHTSEISKRIGSEAHQDAVHDLAGFQLPRATYTACEFIRTKIAGMGQMDAGRKIWTCLYDGLYLITSCLNFAAAPGGIREIHIAINGGNHAAQTVPVDTSGGNSGNGIPLATSMMIDLVAGDTVQINAFQNQTAAASLGFNSVNPNRFEVTALRIHSKQGGF